MSASENYKDYHTGGMLLPGRSFTSNSYRYGFNGQEKDDEVSGNTGSHTTAMFWEYDSRTGRRWNLDPITKPNLGGYTCFSNSPLLLIDPDGDDNFLAKSDGTIQREKTKDKTHSYYYQDKKGKVSHLGTFTIKDAKKDLIELPLKGDGWIKKDKNEKNFLAGDAAAIFLSVAKEFKGSTGNNIYVTQFSTSEGGHSGHGGPGDWVDIKYVDNKGGYASTTDDDYNSGQSQKIVDLYRKFGYVFDTRRNKSKWDIITGDEDGKPALVNTKYVEGHISHIHVGNYGFNHVKVVKALDQSIPKIAPKPPQIPTVTTYLFGF